MAVQLSEKDLTIHTFPRHSMTSGVDEAAKKGEEIRKSTLKEPSTNSLLYNASQGNLRRYASNTISFPSVSDFASQTSTGNGPPVAMVQPVTMHHDHLQQQPSTGQIEPRVIRRSRISELMVDVQNSAGLSDTVRKYLAEADEHILQKRNADAIPCLEAALLSTGESPQLQCLLWRLLGNAHLSLGHYKKASVCHMHQVAFCRELDDFAGMTMAECNLGIAYMKLGLLKLSGRCFSQYLDNSRVLMDEMGIAYACSNLGVLTKMIAEEEYQKLEGEDRASKSKNKDGMEAFKEYVRKAITYFEQHLEIVEKQSDLEKQGRVYSHLGSCYEMLHQYPQAIFCHQKRLDIVRSTGDHSSEICTLCNLGNCLRATGKLQDAVDNYSLGLELCQATDDKLGESKILLNLGTTCQLLGQNQKAIEWYTLYYCMCVEANDVTGQTRASGTLAELYHCLGQEPQAHEYFKKLAHNLKSIGDNEGAIIARQLVIKSRQAMQKQKERRKSVLTKKGPLMKKGLEKYLRASVEGSLDKLHTADSPMVKGKKTEREFVGTWSPGLKRWYNARLMPASAGGTWSHDIRKGVVAKNRHSYQEALKLSSQHSNLYRTRGMISKLNAQEDLEELMKSVRPSFYTLGDFMEPIHHRVTSDEGSITEYEDVEDENNPRLVMPSAFGSSRHIKNLKHVGKSLLDSDNPVEQSQQTTEAEWLQWLELHNVAPDGVDHSLAQKENKPPLASPPPIAPKPQKIQKAPPPPPPPPPPLPSQKKGIKPIVPTKKSFRGLSIFSSNNRTSSQANLLQESRATTSSSISADSLSVTRKSGVDTSLVIENRGIGEVPVTFRESQVI